MPDFSVKINAQQQSRYEISGYYEYPTWDLKRELSERKRDKALFQSDELAILLRDSISGLAFLQSHKIVHGNL